MNDTSCLAISYIACSCPVPVTETHVPTCLCRGFLSRGPMASTDHHMWRYATHCQRPGQEAWPSLMLQHCLACMWDHQLSGNQQQWPARAGALALLAKACHVDKKSRYSWKDAVSKYLRCSRAGISEYWWQYVGYECDCCAKKDYSGIWGKLTSI